MIIPIHGISVPNASKDHCTQYILETTLYKSSSLYFVIERHNRLRYADYLLKDESLAILPGEYDGADMTDALLEFVTDNECVDIFLFFAKLLPVCCNMMYITISIITKSYDKTLYIKN